MYRLFLGAPSDRPDPEGWVLGNGGQPPPPAAAETEAAAGQGDIRHDNEAGIPLNVDVSDIHGDHCSTLSDAIEVENFEWWLQNQRQYLLQQQQAGLGGRPAPIATESNDEDYTNNELVPASQNQQVFEEDNSNIAASAVVSQVASEQESSSQECFSESEEENDDDDDDETEEVKRNRMIQQLAQQVTKQEPNPTTTTYDAYAQEDIEAIFRALDTQSTSGTESNTNQQNLPQAAASESQQELAPNNVTARRKNQLDLDNGSYTEEDIEAIHRVLNTESSVLGGGKWEGDSVPQPPSTSLNPVSDRPQQTAGQENDVSARPKYASASIIKPSKRTELGLVLRTDQDGAIKIQNLSTNGFLFVSGAPLEQGDQLICIKTDEGSLPCGSNVGGFSKNEIIRLLRKTEGQITIIVQHATGNPERIEAMTSKPHPEFGTGIFFASGVAAEWRSLHIHSVPSNGLFAHSLLHCKDKVLSINGVDCSNLDASVATDIVKSAPRFVVIVTQTTSANLMNAISSTADDPAAFLRSVPEERRSSLNFFRRS